MGNFIVKIEGPFMEIYQYIREQGFCIQDAKKMAKQQPTVLVFDSFGKFSECVKYFHRIPFKVEADCDFEFDMTGMAPSNVFNDDVETLDELHDEIHLSNIELINAIVYWQQSEDTVKFLCENDNSHTPLYAGIDTENDTVVMGCPDCDYIREDVPDTILDYYKKNKK